MSDPSWYHYALGVAIYLVAFAALAYLTERYRWPALAALVLWGLAGAYYATQ